MNVNISNGDSVVGLNVDVPVTMSHRQGKPRCAGIDPARIGFAYEGANWEIFNAACREIKDLDPRDKVRLQNVMQGWCSCLFQLWFTILMIFCFILSFGNFWESYPLSESFARLNEEFEKDIRVPEDFMTHVRRMEASLMKTTYNANDTSECGKMFHEHCIMGSKNDTLMQLIQNNCWFFTENTGYVDEYNRLMYSSYTTQTRRAVEPCASSAIEADPFVASRECLSRTKEATSFEVTEGPCLGRGTEYIPNDPDSCFKFSGFKFNSAVGMFVNNLPEASEAWPGYNLCRVDEFIRLKWADERSKRLCHKFNLINMNANKLLRYSNCFTFELTGTVTREKVVTVLNLVTYEVYWVAAPLCIVGIAASLFRLWCTTLFFWKEVVHGNYRRSRNRNFLCGVLRDITLTEHLFYLASSLLFILFFVMQLDVLTQTLNLSYVDEAQGMTKVDANAVFVKVFFFKVFDFITVLEYRSQVASVLAMVAFLFNTIIFVFELNFHPRLGIVGSILGAVYHDLMAFAIVIFTLMLLSCMIAYTIFGRFWAEFADLPTALESVASAFLGDVGTLISNSDAVPPDFVVALFHVFIWFLRLLGSVLLLNLLISIFAKSYERRKVSRANHVQLFYSAYMTLFYWTLRHCSSKESIKLMIRKSILSPEEIRRVDLLSPIIDEDPLITLSRRALVEEFEFEVKPVSSRLIVPENVLMKFLKRTGIDHTTLRSYVNMLEASGITNLDLLQALNLSEQDLIAIGINNYEHAKAIVNTIEAM